MFANRWTWRCKNETGAFEVFFLLIPFLSSLVTAQPSVDPEEGERTLQEVNTNLRRIADALEWNLKPREAELRMKKVEVAAQIHQVHWERIGRLRKAAETAKEAANSAEKTEKVRFADLENLEERERELHSLAATLDPEEFDAQNQELREERRRQEAYIEQTKERAWRLRDQALLYQSELEMILSKTTYIEEIVTKWLEEFE